LLAVTLCFGTITYAHAPADKPVEKAAEKPGEKMHLMLEKVKVDKKAVGEANMTLTIYMDHNICTMKKRTK